MTRMRWLVVLCLLGCKQPRERMSADKTTYSFADPSGTTSVSDLYRRASERLDHNDNRGAARLYQQAADAEPDKPMGWVGLGSCALRDKDYDKAEKYYLKAAALDDKYGAAYVGLGTVNSLQGRHREAAYRYERALAIDDNNADAHWGLALTYQSLGERDKMRSHARQFLALQPNSLIATRARGMLAR
jgi:tetratricopeptide (TPR) repeat protein